MRQAKRMDPRGHRIVDWVVRGINRVLNRVGGHYVHEEAHTNKGGGVSKEPRLSLSWQNLRTARDDQPCGFPWHGRCWLWLRGGERARTLQLEWSLGSWRCAVGFDVDPGERELSGNLSMPPVSLYFASEGFMPERFWDWWDDKYSYDGREVRVQVSDGALRWSFWMNPHEWNATDPRWRSGSWSILDTLFGPQDYTAGTPAVHDVLIPLPEGAYPAQIQLQDDRWSRKRWPWWPLSETVRRAHIDIPQGIPFQGKGENGWDCGEDGFWGVTAPAASLEAAIAYVVQEVLKKRARYDSEGIHAVYPHPATRIVRDDGTQPPPQDA